MLPGYQQGRQVCSYVSSFTSCPSLVSSSRFLSHPHPCPTSLQTGSKASSNFPRTRSASISTSASRRSAKPLTTCCRATSARSFTRVPSSSWRRSRASASRAGEERRSSRSRRTSSCRRCAFRGVAFRRKLWKWNNANRGVEISFMLLKAK